MKHQKIRLTLSELKERLEKHKPQTITFSSKEQPCYDCTHPIQLNMTFSTILVNPRSSQVAIKTADNNTMNFPIVKYVEITSHEFEAESLVLICKTSEQQNFTADNGKEMFRIVEGKPIVYKFGLWY